MKEKTRSSIFRQVGKISYSMRERLVQQRALTIWLTGLSASGKSTTAYALEMELVPEHLCYVLDGDNLRHGINSDLGFSSEDRTENIRRVAEMARLMNDAGLIVIVSLISPLVSDRDMAKATIGAENFIEVYLNTPLEVCEERDSKQLYSKARKGLIADFTGISAPYEAPPTADICINTLDFTPAEAAQQILRLVKPRVKVSFT
jgi:adenylylsulfate kinase